MKRTAFLARALCIAILICSGEAAVAQQSANPVITGYFVSVNGQSTGPYDNYGLRQLINQGQLTKNSLVWKEGMAGWIFAGAVEELAPLFSSATPPPLQSSQTPPPVAGQTPPPAPGQTPQQPPQTTAPAAVSVVDANYTNFTSGQRWATFGLNWLIPGLGSFVIMHDKKGGGVNMGLGLTSYALIIAGGVVASTAYTYSSYSGYKLNEGQYIAGIVCISAGGAFEIATMIHNIVRSFKYDRPHQTASVFDPNSWDLAIVPGRNGIQAVSLSYKMQF